MTSIRLLFATVVVLAALAALVTNASAFSARIERGGAISATSLGKITFGTSPTVQCSLTLNGSLRTAASLAAGETLGSITEVRIGACSGSQFERALSLPWPLKVETVPGGLPDEARVIQVSIPLFAFNVSTFFELVNCLYAGRWKASIALNDAGTNIYTTGLLAIDEARLPFARGSEACPESWELRGRFSISPQQSITVS